MHIPNFGSRTRIIADLTLLSIILSAIQSLYSSGGYSYFETANPLILLTCLTCWFLAANALGLYNDFRSKPFSSEWVVFLKALVLYTLVVSFIFFLFFGTLPYIRYILSVHCALIFVFMPVQKLVIRIMLKVLLNRNDAVKNVLIVGAGDIGMDFYERYIKNENYGFRLTGFVDDKKNPALNGKYLGNTSEIEKVVDRHELDEIILTLPMDDERQMKKIISVGEKAGKRIRIIQDYQHLGATNLHVDKLGTLTVITLRALPLDIRHNQIFKRLFDIVFSFMVAVFLLSWMIPIISIVIKLSSRGPIFFKQVRLGLNNKPIMCYKFRSMATKSREVDETGNFIQASKNDPRVTAIGRFLRKTNLDELPQFFCVLNGSMSVVGPRPHPVALNLKSKDCVENYMKRHWVKPGITGWAQTQGYRGETRNPIMMQKRVEADLWYIENWSFWLDLQIILQTLVNMVKGEENAY
jgi:putative colanic acid biosynthesis UDP-glucose lipid carrier transferase